MSDQTTPPDALVVLPPKPMKADFGYIQAFINSRRSQLIKFCPAPDLAPRITEVFLALAKDKNIQLCTTDSVLFAAMNIVKLGLVPDSQIGHVYVVPFKGKATVVVGYKGLIHLACRAGADAVDAEYVHVNDDLEYGLRDGVRIINWTPYWARKDKIITVPGALIGILVTLHIKGKSLSRIIPKAVLDDRRDKSPMKHAGAWVTSENAMYLKTGIREAARLWDLSPDVQRAIMVDEAPEVQGKIHHTTETPDIEDWGIDMENAVFSEASEETAPVPGEKTKVDFSKPAPATEPAPTPPAPPGGDMFGAPPAPPLPSGNSMPK